MSKPIDLVQGTLDLLLLKILALEPLHGWAISLRLKSISGDVLQVSEGSLYPALHKLEQVGWITAEWKQTENNRRGSEKKFARRLFSVCFHSAVIQPSCSNFCKAGERDPSLTCSTSPGMDFRRRLMAHPCKGSSARIFKSSRSRVP